MHHKKPFGGQTPPGPAEGGGLIQRSTRPLSWTKGVGPGMEGKRERVEEEVKGREESR